MFKLVLLTSLLAFAAMPMNTHTGLDICTNNNLHPEHGGPYSGQVEEPVQFIGSLSADDNCCGITKFNWTWGDGSADGPFNYVTVDTTHTYAAAGTYNVRLTMWNTGAAGICQVTTTVTISQ